MIVLYYYHSTTHSITTVLHQRNINQLNSQDVPWPNKYAANTNKKAESRNNLVMIYNYGDGGGCGGDDVGYCDDGDGDDGGGGDGGVITLHCADLVIHA